MPVIFDPKIIVTLLLFTVLFFLNNSLLLKLMFDFNDKMYDMTELPILEYFYI